MTALRLLESLHGHLAVLAVAALVHPAITLRRGRPLPFRTKLSVGFATLFSALAFGSGAFIYGDYRRLVKRPLFHDDATAGLFFETKEHLAFFVLCLALGGAVVAFAAPRDAEEQRRLGGHLYAAAAVLGLVTLGLGTFIAAVRGFGSP